VYFSVFSLHPLSFPLQLSLGGRSSGATGTASRTTAVGPERATRLPCRAWGAAGRTARAYGRRGGHNVEFVVGGRLRASSTHRRISATRSTELGHRGARGGRLQRRRRAWDNDDKLVGGISVFSLHTVSRSRAPLMSESASAGVVGVRTHPHALPVSELVLIHTRAAGVRVRARRWCPNSSARAAGVRAHPRPCARRRSTSSTGA
jgi:hypothetical protein